MASILAFASALTHGCEAPDVYKTTEKTDLPLESWDFSEGMAAEEANWGAEGWETTTEISDSQFKGPVYLRILLPGGRSLEGRFEFVHVSRDRGQVEVFFFFPPTTAEKARDIVRALLASADESVPESNRARVDAWYKAGPKSGPGEELNLILSESGSSVEIGVSIDWVPVFGDDDGRWRVFGGLGACPSNLDSSGASMV